MTEHFDRIVVGAGAMGLAATWQLASRGLRVLLLERFTAGHHRGASHGATRNMNNAYARPPYLELYDAALPLWRELESRSSRQLLELRGLVTHGDDANVQRTYEALVSRGARVERVSGATAKQRWAGMNFSGDAIVSLDAGRINSAATLEVLAELSRGLGAELRYEHRVTAIEPDSDRVTVSATDTSGQSLRFTAEGLVVAAGAWSSDLLEGVIALPPLRVTEEHPSHFDILADYSRAEWPSFNHFRPADDNAGFAGNVYGMLTPGEGVKVGFHAVGNEVDPDNRPFGAPEEARDQLREYVAQWFPGLDPRSAREISCTYTMTQNEDFIIDRQGPVTVAAGFSGHGFKFTPVIGSLLADATLGSAPTPSEFLLASH